MRGGNPYISAGGIVGLHQGDNNLTVSYCYSYMEWGGDVGNQTGRYPIVNITNPFGTNYNAELSNTYYLQGGGLWNSDDSVTKQSNLVNCMAGVADIGTADADHTFIPSNVTGLTGNYPYPAVVTDEEGKYVHYGDWPTP